VPANTPQYLAHESPFDPPQLFQTQDNFAATHYPASAAALLHGCRWE